jgi:single-stranded DNA-binding protein
MRLGDGDAVSVQGPLKVETYEKDGATKLSLSVVADHVMALRQPPKERKAAEA